ncbi:monooxygenase 2-like [Diospyros lotus]|uniref:monooxygenase 2-like n=1 Tax=Diospyros lotus TaxID=55363 RepID=UPI00224E330A|nr:monooxygenase 2-like [Diospyros lotus]
MAARSLLFLNSSLSTSFRSPSLLGLHRGRRLAMSGAAPICLSTSGAEAEPGEARKEDIVIVGAGIAGLATAVALHRLGVRTVVLEQAESLRTGGTSLTFFKNGWRALDAIGVGNLLRPQFLEIQGITTKAEDGRELRSFIFKDTDESQEVRPVERRVLLETLANQLPKDTIKFSAKLAKVKTSQSTETLLELTNGTKLSAKIAIGCDGIWSSVAKSMGFSDPKYVGHCALRGLGLFPNGHSYEPMVNYIYGRGVRGGYVPITPTKVFWFMMYNSSTPGPSNTDPAALKKQAKELVRNWSLELLSMIDLTPDDAIIKSPLADRWLWPAISPPAFVGKTVLVGDAWHPMTPNLGQGACCALEDSVILARKLASALNTGSTTVEDALKSYESERWPRIFPMTVRSSFTGSILQWDNPMFCSFRDNVLIPKLVRPGPMLEHTNFDCGTL